MAKKMCDLTKGGVKKGDRKAFVKAVTDAAYFCEKCGRVASDKKQLCKPQRIKEE